MTSQLALFLVGAGIVACLMALVTVIIARGMDGGAGKSAAKEDGAASGAGSSAAALKHILGSAGAGKMADVQKLMEAGRSSKKTVAALVSIFAGIAASIGIVAAISGRDRTPPVESEIAAGDLHGTLLSPRRNAPVVLIVPGSGPTDRDGNNPMGVRASSYKLLAEGLAEEGIATVRVDKRGMFASAAAGDPNAVTVEEYAKDYRAWIDAIREQTGRKCVWLLGHSEGALMVSAAAEGRRDVCGLILVAGMGRKMGDVLREQLKANPANAPLLGQAFAAIAEIEAGRRVDTSGMHPALMPLFAPQVQDFLISVFAADPVDLIRRARVKTLIVHGTTDLQIMVEDARLLNRAPRTRLELIRGMNHILKEAPEDRAANLATYTDPSLPLHRKLVREIENFIEGD